VAQMTFLDIVNRVIDEGKVQLDPLTSANFASPPRTTLYGKIKQWVNSSYEELIEERTEWQFRIERTTVMIYPRLYVASPASGYIPVVGDTLVGQSSGVSFTVMGVYISETVENTPGVEYTLSVTFTNGTDPANLIMRESLDRYVTGVLDLANALTLYGLGRYDFSDLLTGIENIDMDTVRAHHIPSEAVTYGENLTERHPVLPVLWNKWPSDYDMFPFADNAIPRYITEAPNGEYALYPIPSGPILLSFDYRRKVTPMAAYNDTPEGLPERYHMYLVWRTLEELADYDKNGALYSRAQKHLNRYDVRMTRDELPFIRIGGWNER
jgi:hypothetical protein